MTEHEIYLKLQEAITAVDLYQKNINEGVQRNWTVEINRELGILTQKGHMLASSGNICKTCSGTGRA